MTLTIGIVNYNTMNQLKRCIKSIKKNVKDISYRIFIVDNNSSDGSREFIKKTNMENLTYILNSNNRGFGAACNQILRRTGSPYILFLNPDISVKKSSIGKLLGFLKRNDEVAIVTGKLLNPDGSTQLSLRRFPTPLRALFGRESLIKKIFPNNKISREYLLGEIDYNSIQYPDWVRGAVMMGRTERLKEIDGFDEEFFLYLEDTDLCLQLRKKGYEIAYVPDAKFIHELGGSTEKKYIFSKIHHNISMYRYMKKNLGYNKVTMLIFLTLLFLRLSLLTGYWIFKRIKK